MSIPVKDITTVYISTQQLGTGSSSYTLPERDSISVPERDSISVPRFGHLPPMTRPKGYAPQHPNRPPAAGPDTRHPNLLVAVHPPHDSAPLANGQPETRRSACNPYGQAQAEGLVRTCFAFDPTRLHPYCMFLHYERPNQSYKFKKCILFTLTNT